MGLQFILSASKPDENQGHLVRRRTRESAHNLSPDAEKITSRSAVESFAEMETCRSQGRMGEDGGVYVSSFCLGGRSRTAELG